MITLLPGDIGELYDETWVVIERVAAAFTPQWRCLSAKRDASRVIGALGDPRRTTLEVGQELRWEGHTVEITALGSVFATVQLSAKAREVELLDLYHGGTVAFGEGPAMIPIGMLVKENRRTLTFIDVAED